MKKNKTTIILVLFFFIGLAILIYPSFSNYYNEKIQTANIDNYEERISVVKKDDYTKEDTEYTKIHKLEYYDNILNSNTTKDNINNNYRLILEREFVNKIGYDEIQALVNTYSKYRKTLDWILESDETNPTNAYGETKLCMEKMMKWADKAHGVKYISLRYFNVAGAHESGEIGEDHNPETHLIPLILQVPLGKREFISIFGDDYETHDGTCIRDYIHVTDLADAHILAVHKLREGSESNIYNLGSGNGFTVKEMIETARKVTGHEIPAKVCERRAGDPAKLVASSEKARRELGWVPKHENVEDMISSAWNWHQKHPNGFEK